VPRPFTTAQTNSAGPTFTCAATNAPVSACLVYLSYCHNAPIRAAVQHEGATALDIVCARALRCPLGERGVPIMQRIAAAALGAAGMLLLAAADASAKPIVFMVSYYDLDVAKTECDMVMLQAPEAAETVRDLADGPFGGPADWVYDAVNGANECNSVQDTRELGRRLENELLDALAENPRCGGVMVIRDAHPKYDGGWSEANYDTRQKKPHWDLMLDYVPGKKTYGWMLFPKNPGGEFAGAMADGEGSTPVVAEQICIVVSGQGAGVHQ
jgi:hypothetical protein